MRTLGVVTLLLCLLSGPLNWAAAADAGAVATPEASFKSLRERQKRISAKAVAYLWDQELDPETGRIGKVQGRYLQALAYLALVADGSEWTPARRDRLQKVIESLRNPLAELSDSAAGPRKVFVGTSREFLAFETHAVVALAYEQLAASDLGDPALNEVFFRGAESAIDYVMDYRHHGRDYDRAGGWPVNAAPYNRNRPDRRCTAWQLLLLKAHYYNGGKVDSTALKEAPNFIAAAQRLAPAYTERIQQAAKAHQEWLPKIRRGERPPTATLDLVNEYFEYLRQQDEAGGFGLDTLGIVTPNATAVGLFTIELFDLADRERETSAVQALVRMPMAWDAQRFFLAQFFAVRGLYMYSLKYGAADYQQYLNRLLTLMEQKQDSDGSFPLGSSGVEELTQMERIYTTAMCVLIVNCDRGNLLFDRPPY